MLLTEKPLIASIATKVIIEVPSQFTRTLHKMYFKKKAPKNVRIFSPKQLHRHVYIDAKKLPEGRRKNNLTDREFRPHHGWS